MPGHIRPLACGSGGPRNSSAGRGPNPQAGPGEFEVVGAEAVTLPRLGIREVREPFILCLADQRISQARHEPAAYREVAGPAEGVHDVHVHLGYRILDREHRMGDVVARPEQALLLAGGGDEQDAARGGACPVRIPALVPATPRCRSCCRWRRGKSRSCHQASYLCRDGPGGRN